MLAVFAKVLEASVRQSAQMTLQPVTDQPELASRLVRVLYEYAPRREIRRYRTSKSSPVWSDYGPHSRFRAEVVDHDLRTVGVDLSLVPLDDVLAYRLSLL